MDRTRSSVPLVVLVLVVLGACGGDAPPAPVVPGIPETVWLATPPPPLGVLAAKTGAVAGADIVVVGRVRAFAEKRAQFELVDMSLTPCNLRAQDSCPTPWDYCCEDQTEVARGTLVVELRDGDELVKGTLLGFHGFDRLKEVIVQGTVVSMDTGGNVIVAAHGLHVR